MFELSASEVRALLRVLDDYIPRLRVEVHRTQYNRELRRELEHEEVVLTRLRDRLNHEVVVSAT